MSIKRPRPQAIRDSPAAPEPEGPEEVYRKFQRLNGRGLARGPGDLRGPTRDVGKKAFYGAFVVVEAAAIVLGLVFEVPFMDIVALGLPGLLVMFHGGSGNKDESPEEPGDKGLLDRMRGLLEDLEEPASNDDRRRTREE